MTILKKISKNKKNLTQNLYKVVEAGVFNEMDAYAESGEIWDPLHSLVYISFSVIYGALSGLALDKKKHMEWPQEFHDALDVCGT